jgi:uncharacterized protein (DUF58 family)
LARRSLARQRFVEGETIEEEIELQSSHRSILRFTLSEPASPGLRPLEDDRIQLTLGPRGMLTHRLRFQAETWGAHELGPLKLIVSDALCLFERDVQAAPVANVRVLPVVRTLGKFRPRAANPERAIGAHTVTRPGDGFEFFALRGYQPGDSIRSINWKASARAGDTIVNQPSRESFARAVVIVDLREKETIGPAAHSPLVRNGRAAAAILAHHERMKDHVTLLALSSATRRLSIEANPRVSDLLEGLVSLRPEGDASLAAGIRENLGILRPRSPVYILTSAALDPDLQDALRMICAIGANVIMVRPSLAPDSTRPLVVDESRTRALDDARAAGVAVVEWPLDGSLEASILAA